MDLRHRTGDRRGQNSQRGTASGHGEEVQPGTLQGIGSAGCAGSHMRPGNSRALGFSYRAAELHFRDHLSLQ